MRYIIFSLLGLLLVSCGHNQSKTQITEVENDSLKTVISTKDSLINEVFSSLNEIASNLNAIKERENLVSSYVENRELHHEPTNQIKEDIYVLDELIINNRSTIQRLEANVSNLRKSEVRIPSLEGLIYELKTQMDGKDQEIQSLKFQVAAMSTQVDQLASQVNGLSTHNQRLEEDMQNTANVLNNAYYIAGSQKELLDKGIVYKSGFIGKTLKINENRSLDDLAKVDIRRFDEIILGQQNVRIISAHPDKSYEMVMKDKNTTSSIVIVDKSKFWEYSKVLVIVYK